jgi:hypothetical protein
VKGGGEELKEASEAKEGVAELRRGEPNQGTPFAQFAAVRESHRNFREAERHKGNADARPGAGWRTGQVDANSGGDPIRKDSVLRADIDPGIHGVITGWTTQEHGNDGPGAREPTAQA